MITYSLLSYATSSLYWACQQFKTWTTQYHSIHSSRNTLFSSPPLSQTILPCQQMEISQETPLESDNIETAAGGSVWEIEELPLSGVSEPRHSRVADGGDVYVAVGKTSSSIDALSWALTHHATPSSIVYLIHVFPEVHSIPTPLGVVPKHRVSPHQVERYMSQERVKRSQMLQKFMNLCQASKVQVETLLVESDLVAKAVVELISVLGIKRLIVGTTKSNIRKLKGSSKAEKIQKTAPHYCEVKVICGKEAIAYPEISSPPPVTAVGNKNGHIGSQLKEDTVSCHCFSRNFK